MVLFNLEFFLGLFWGDDLIPLSSCKSSLVDTSTLAWMHNPGYADQQFQANLVLTTSITTSSPGGQKCPTGLPHQKT